MFRNRNAARPADVVGPLDGATRTLQAGGVPVQLAAFRLVEGRLEVVVVAAGHGDLRESLDALDGGPGVIQATVNAALPGYDDIALRWENERTWTRSAGDRSWVPVTGAPPPAPPDGPVVPVPRYFVGVTPEPPGAGRMRAIYQAAQYAPSLEAAGAALRPGVARLGWRTCVFHLMNGTGRLYRWDGGRFFDDPVLVDQIPDDPTAFVLVAERDFDLVAGLDDDTRLGHLQAGIAALGDAIAAGTEPLTVRVVSTDGATAEYQI